MPRYRNSSNTECGIYIRYNQYNHADGVVYLDDLTVKSDKPMRVNFVSDIVSDTILQYYLVPIFLNILLGVIGD